MAGTNAPMPMNHDQFVENFANNAGACFSPKKNGNDIYCQKIARFAHYTLTFIDIKSNGNNYLKLEYKMLFKEKNGQSCIERANINPEKLRLYQSTNFKAEISPEDIEIRNGAILEKSISDLIAREKAIGDTCYKFALINSNEIGIQYKIKADEYINNAPNGKSEELAIFSNGAPLFIEIPTSNVK